MVVCAQIDRVASLVLVNVAHLDISHGKTRYMSKSSADYASRKGMCGEVGRADSWRENS